MDPHNFHEPQIVQEPHILHELQHASTMPTWTIVGRGAIGLLCAANAAQQGYPRVQLALRTPAASPQGFAFTWCLGQQESPIIVSQLHDTTLIDYLLVPVKAFDALSAVQQWLPRLSPSAQIVLCHNGLGTIEQILPLLGKDQGLWFASTTHGAYKSSATRVVHSGQGSTYLGALNTSATHAAKTPTSDILPAIDAMLGPCQLVDDIMPFLWQKLAINLVINPLTALHRVKNGELAAPQFQQTINALIAEFCQIAAACGYAMSPISLGDKVRTVIANTAQNNSSMLQDVRHQRPTELPFITGFLLEKAAQQQVPCPQIVALTKALEATL